MSAATKPFNICDTLRKRLDEINNKKEATQNSINNTNEQLQKLFSKGSKNSRQTPAQLDAKINELETKRTSSSLRLAEEKAILREIAQIQKAKVAYEEGRVHEKLIQDKKSELNELRTELTNYKAQIAELEAALSKVELADRLGCTANDLKSHKMDCPKDKLGQVIGKGGSNIKKLEKETGCLIDLDKVKSQIHLQGNELSIKKAIGEIENITLAIDVEMKLSKALFSFLFNKQLSEFNKLQQNHPNVNFDLSKETLLLKLRGKEEYVFPAKEDVSSVDVRMETLVIPGREAAVIVGKAGKTINRLVADHDVSIQVENQKKGDEDKSTILVSGQGDKVEIAMKEIKDILFKSEDIEVQVLVTPMTRNKLLTSSGALIKQLQKDVNEACKPGNSFVRFEELSREERETSSILIVKSPRMHIELAEKIVKERIEEYDSALITVQIDIDLIPVIIGSKGATIKSIRKLGGEGADIEVDKVTGEVKIMADSQAGRVAMKEAVDKLVDENQILRVPMAQSMFADFFGQSGKAVKSKVQDSGVFIKNDDTDTAILLRGSIEKITEAAEEIRQFIASNQSIELELDVQNESFLSRRSNMLKDIEKKFDVNLGLRKGRQTLVLRGESDCIKSAEEEMKRILFGGADYAVQKIFVPSLIMGIIIGKSGKNITKYESDYDNVMVNIHSTTRCLTIRGTPDQVEACKRMITKDIVQCNVSESIQINADGLAKLSKPGTLDKVLGGLPVTYTLVQTSLRLKGAYSDVKEVMTQVNDLLTGVYKAEISLIPENFKKVQNAIKNPEQLDTIRQSTSTTIKLDESNGAFSIEGKRSNVRRAKTLLVTFLVSVAPSQFSKVKFLKPLLKSMGSSKEVGDLSMNTGCHISLERDICAFVVQSTSVENLRVGVKALEKKIESCMKLTYVMQVESWLIQHLISKNMAEIETMRENSECEITLSKNDLMICIIGKEEEKVSEAKTSINAVMNDAKKENSFVELPESSMNQFVGTSGKQMSLFAKTYGVSMERVKKSRTQIRIQGKETSVSRASNAVSDWVSQWEKKNGGVTLDIEVSVIAHLDNKSIIDDIQRHFGVKVDINRNKGTATIRGGKNGSQAKASTKLESIISEIIDTNTNKNNDQENEVVIPSNTASTPFVENTVVHSPITEIESENDNGQKNANSAIGKLYNLLVSDDVAAVAVASDAQEWDSSTVSSGLESEIESPETGVSYLRSASGFHIRL